MSIVVPADSTPSGPGSVPGVPVSISPPAQPPLPRTGAELFAVLVLAVVLLTLGALLLQASRRRCRRRPVPA